MTELRTPETASIRPRTSAAALLGVAALMFVSAVGVVRDWTDVKLSAAIAAVVCVGAGRGRFGAAAIGSFAGHVVLGATIDVHQWPTGAWVVVAAFAVLDCYVLVRLLEAMTTDSTTRLPSHRVLAFLVGAGCMSIVSGLLEARLLAAIDAAEVSSAIDIVFGLAIASVLAAIAVTRRGSEWFSSERLPGAELLAPLMVVLVTIVAVQVTRQLWSQRDEDRLEVVASSAGSSVTSIWEREVEVMDLTATFIAPSVAFDAATFADLASPYLEESESAFSAALVQRAGAAGDVVILDSLADDAGAPANFADDQFWTKHGMGDFALIEDLDEPVIVRSAELVSLPEGGDVSMVVAFSLPSVVEQGTQDPFGRFDEVVVGVGSTGGSSSRSIWAQSGFDPERRAVSSGIMDIGDIVLVVETQPTSSFGSPWSTKAAVLGFEAVLGGILFGVLVLGANAQFTMSQERRRRENLLEAALDAAPGTSIVYGGDFRALAANRPLRERFPGQIPGLDVLSVFEFGAQSGRRKMLEDLLRTALEGRPAQIEISEDSSEDSPSPNRMRIIELSAYPVTSPGGEPIGFLHSVDATERRSLAMRSAQSERMESLGALAGGLAHDFNNLLFVTLGNLQLMAMNETVTADEKLSKFLSRSMTAVERGAEITKSLLAVARSQPLEESAVSLADLVKGILPLVRQALGAGRRVDVDITDPGLVLMVDSGRLSSCILNLAFNARDAMGPNGTLRISAHLDETTDMIELSVADDGAGMPPEVVDRAFEPFFTTKSAGSGTGLGLATVYAFAKQSGGTAYLESRVGSGTTVTLVLPRHTGSAPTAAVVASRRAGRRVVVADDEQSLAEMVAAWLIDMGIDARFATSPKSALELIETFEPDVLVSDANFGEELDGIELARLGTAIVPDMAVVFMTGYSSSMRELQELGERTLAKPFSREDLYSALSPLIAEEGAATSTRAAKRSAGGKRKKSS